MSDDQTPDFRMKNYTPDPVNRPKHYNMHPSGIQCIEITQHMDFCTGNAIKYIWRHNNKQNPVQDLRKAIWYLEQKIKLLTEHKEK